MKSKSILSAVAAMALMTGPAQAFMLTNEDDKTHVVDIIFGKGDGASDITVELVPGEVVEGLCGEGCVVSLENGAEQSFTGSETVTIKKGNFTLEE